MVTMGGLTTRASVGVSRSSPASCAQAKARIWRSTGASDALATSSTALRRLAAISIVVGEMASGPASAGVEASASETAASRPNREVMVSCLPTAEIRR